MDQDSGGGSLDVGQAGVRGLQALTDAGQPGSSGASGGADAAAGFREARTVKRLAGGEALYSSLSAHQHSSRWPKSFHCLAFITCTFTRADRILRNCQSAARRRQSISRTSLSDGKSASTCSCRILAAFEIQSLVRELPRSEMSMIPWGPVGCAAIILRSVRDLRPRNGAVSLIE